MTLSSAKIGGKRDGLHAARHAMRAASRASSCSFFNIET
jgi:hypothetical protein